VPVFPAPAMHDQQQLEEIQMQINTTVLDVYRIGLVSMNWV
jgi:hypothetical protein